MPPREYYISLAQSYGRPLSRKEWDALPSSIPSSREVMEALVISNWEEFWKLCSFEEKFFSKDAMLSLGKTIGIDIKIVSPERWDLIAKNLKPEGIIMPSSAAILRDYSSNWKNFQNAVVYSQKYPQRDYFNKLERLFLAGCATVDIARKVGGQKKKVLRDLESIGFYTQEHLAERFPSIENIMHRPLKQFKSYNGEQKQQMRNLMLEEIKKLSEPMNLHYMGLPGPQFIDYVQFFDKYEIIPSESLAAEHDRMAANFMISLKRWQNVIEGGERFRKLKIYRGPIEKALAIEKYSEMKFNIINLDWTGGWAKNKQEAIVNLFERDHLMDEAILFITLNDTPFERARAKSGRGYSLEHGGTDSHLNIAKESILYNAKRKFREIKELFAVPYKDSQDMIGAAYLIRRVKTKK